MKCGKFAKSLQVKYLEVKGLSYCSLEESVTLQKLREGTFNFARNFCSGVVGSP